MDDASGARSTGSNLPVKLLLAAAALGLLARLAHAWGFEVYNMDCA